MSNLLKDLQWNETGQWCWTHPGTGVSFSLNPGHGDFPADKKLLGHVLRSSWRLERWKKFLGSGRRDAAQLTHWAFSEERLKKAQAACKTQDRHVVAILRGAFVSPKRWQVMARDPNTARSGGCPFCGHAVGTRDHVLWACKVANPDQTSPADELERHLGWPTDGDFEPLRQMAAIRRQLLELRRN